MTVRIDMFSVFMSLNSRSVAYHTVICLLYLDKLRDSNDIDNIISAEIPDENDEPELFD